MPQNISVENNFTGGLKTEFTGLNFPENACTDAENCIFTIIGDVLSREGFDFEANFSQNVVNRTNASMSSFKWDNVGGDGSTQIIVQQIGSILYFYLSSSATNATPLSTQKLSVAIDLMGFLPGGSAFAALVPLSECQFASGNGYLFVFHPYLNPFYCSFTPGTLGTAVVTPAAITINIRDFEGLNSDASGLYSNTRPVTLQPDHLYNLTNQGWDLTKANTFQTAAGFYPSNSDVWWRFKDISNIYNPTTTLANVLLAGPAPKGSKILDTFNQVRINPTSIITTYVRPKTGTWFQGRVWYAGADVTAQGAHTFSETIYFSQVIVTPDQFGFCYQSNDPTDESLFDLLPTDGGVIKIQGCGAIYKLFPIQNGVLVFAANGIWFITGRQGIGFTANDYTVTKISSVQAISPTSFINILGYPIFWNEEGIYTVSPGQTGSLSVDNLCVGTIASFYESIPLQSKKFARGDYNPIDFQVQWCFRSTNESTVTDRYQYDSILVLNTVNKAFYPYSLTGTPFIHDIRFVAGPGGSTSPDPVFKYLTSSLVSGSYNFTFSEERDGTNFVDWHSFDNVGVPYVSTFTTGYKLRGKAITRWQPIYVNVLSRNTVPTAYSIQGYWDYPVMKPDGRSDSNRTSNLQTVRNFSPNFKMLFRRHKIRGHGFTLQIKISSVPGHPFEIMGWSIFENIEPSP